MSQRQFHLEFHVAALLAAALTIALFGVAAAQEANPAKPLPPRATPGDYRAHAQAGTITIAADFAGHGVTTADAVYSTEDYVVVEVGIFGPPGARMSSSYKDFSLQVNGKKGLLQAEPYESAFKSLKDPEWIPPDPGSGPKSKTSVGSSGGGGQNDPPAAPVKMPLALQLAMERKVKMASLAEGERPLPEAGLVFFPYAGKIDKLKSIVLLYSGSVGKATLPLE